MKYKLVTTVTQVTAENIYRVRGYFSFEIYEFAI